MSWIEWIIFISIFVHSYCCCLWQTSDLLLCVVFNSSCVASKVSDKKKKRESILGSLGVNASNCFVAYGFICCHCGRERVILFS